MSAESTNLNQPRLKIIWIEKTTNVKKHTFLRADIYQKIPVFDDFMKLSGILANPTYTLDGTFYTQVVQYFLNWACDFHIGSKSLEQHMPAGAINIYNLMELLFLLNETKKIKTCELVLPPPLNEDDVVTSIKKFSPELQTKVLNKYVESCKNHIDEFDINKPHNKFWVLLASAPLVAEYFFPSNKNIFISVSRIPNKTINIVKKSSYNQIVDYYLSFDDFKLEIYNNRYLLMLPLSLTKITVSVAQAASKRITAQTSLEWTFKHYKEIQKKLDEIKSKLHKIDDENEEISTLLKELPKRKLALTKELEMEKQKYITENVFSKAEIDALGFNT